MSGLDNLDALLEQATSRHGIPGAALAVWHDGTFHESTTGLLNTSTAVEVTPDSVFQIGSITKLFTATLCMQLVEQGRLELDRPVWDYVRAFGLADMTAARQITLRHLLSHSSGMAGDIFMETGDGPDRFLRLIERCRFAPLIHPVGAMNSYCNFGFAVAAHLAELVTLKSWDALMRERIFDPLGIENAFTHPKEAVRYRTAIGHETVETSAVPVKKAYFPSSGAAAGSTPSMTASGLIRFARMALGQGELSGQRLLREKTFLEMVKAQSVINEVSQYGLGWGLGQYRGGLLIGHDGKTPGQCAFLKLVPEKDLAIALLTNHDIGIRLVTEVLVPLYRELAGISIPELSFPESPVSVPLERYEGSYDNYCTRCRIARQPDGLFMDIEPSAAGTFEEFGADGHYRNIPVIPLDDRRFVTRLEKDSPVVPLDFEAFDRQGRPAFMRAFGRLYPRTSTCNGEE